ncbi:LapA family protein [Solitalea sp. MAHUQ-68]|uniref:LapA family protein n=1 Tax=Solitalea agri TaxID=2953739 RepID=A0A9X2EZM7_9SPHI|nr:LapA family protein [Solitalea agri]MCO4291420.1 LapA family protein [Solitalea agri]
MSFKTIFIITVTILLTVIFMQNTSEVNVRLLIWDVRVSFVLLMFSIAILCFLIGYFAAFRQKRAAKAAMPNSPGNDKDLSDEDKNYLQ